MYCIVVAPVSLRPSLCPCIHLLTAVLIFILQLLSRLLFCPLLCVFIHLFSQHNDLDFHYTVLVYYALSFCRIPSNHTLTVLHFTSLTSLPINTLREILCVFLSHFVPLINFFLYNKFLVFHSVYCMCFYFFHLLLLLFFFYRLFLPSTWINVFV